MLSVFACISRTLKVWLAYLQDEDETGGWMDGLLQMMNYGFVNWQTSQQDRPSKKHVRSCSSPITLPVSLGAHQTLNHPFIRTFHGTTKKFIRSSHINRWDLHALSRQALPPTLPECLVTTLLSSFTISPHQSSIYNIVLVANKNSIKIYML